MIYNFDFFKQILALILVFIAIIQDIKYFKVKNSTNLLFIIVGLTISILENNFSNFVLGILFPLSLLPLFIFNMLGAGDIKLFCAIGSIVGYPKILTFVFTSIVLNGIIAFILMFIRKQNFLYFSNWLKLCIFSRKMFPYIDYNKKHSNMFRYTFGIGIAAILIAILKVE